MKISSNYIKTQIANWLTDLEVNRLRHEFIPVMPKDEFEKWAKNPKNWKRETKEKKFFNPNQIEREFDCRPFDSQLRLYVITDNQDTNIVRYYFQTE